MTCERWRRRLQVLVALPLLLTARWSAIAAEPVTLVSNGEAKCCVVVGKEGAFQEPALTNWDPKGTLLAWAAEDLATYLGKISGAKVPVGDKPVEGLVPIYVGCATQEFRLKNATNSVTRTWSMSLPRESCCTVSLGVPSITRPRMCCMNLGCAGMPRARSAKWCPLARPSR